LITLLLSSSEPPPLPPSPCFECSALKLFVCSY
jgi:hypothetical protein